METDIHTSCQRVALKKIDEQLSVYYSRIMSVLSACPIPGKRVAHKSHTSTGTNFVLRKRVDAKSIGSKMAFNNASNYNLKKKLN